MARGCAAVGAGAHLDEIAVVRTGQRRRQVGEVMARPAGDVDDDSALGSRGCEKNAAREDRGPQAAMSIHA